MPAYTRLVPTPGIPWWEKQPGETDKAYSKFIRYREMPVGERSFPKLAEIINANLGTLRNQASAYRWDDRATAWDQEQARLRRAKLEDQTIRLARLHLETALASTGVLARSVKAIADSQEPLPPELMPRWANMIETLRRMALDAPDARIEVSGPGGEPIQIAEFEGLTASERRNRAREMAEGVLRLYQGGKSA